MVAFFGVALKKKKDHMRSKETWTLRAVRCFEKRNEHIKFNTLSK